jgi:hypothetical protein
VSCKQCRELEAEVAEVADAVGMLEWSDCGRYNRATGDEVAKAIRAGGGAVKWHPILFTGPMVRAILEGTKHQTRRVVRLPSGADPPSEVRAEQRRWWMTWEHDPVDPMDHGGEPWSHTEEVRCPYGVPGDRLWVRETWRAEERESDAADGICYRADGAFVVIDNTRAASERWVVAYNNGRHGRRWRPSIFMPRWASRISLEVTGVRVERVQDISEEDAGAEGCVPWRDPGGGVTYRSGFADLWDSINAKRGSAWDANPYVWVIEFRRPAQEDKR